MKMMTMHTLVGEATSYDATEKRLSVVVISRKTLPTVDLSVIPTFTAASIIAIRVLGVS
ncbi:MAG: hypothetical protein ACJAVI_001157 [Candidatus Azotimanducaceae bacterium]|jgi:hypothetical protein